MKDFFLKSIRFVRDVSTDSRIPSWDKAVLAGFAALLVSPIDLIADFIPILGQLDDLVIIILVLDYIFNRLPEEILLAHYPWDPEGLKATRKRMRFLSMLVPDWIRKKIWAMPGASGSPETSNADGVEATP